MSAQEHTPAAEPLRPGTPPGGATARGATTSSRATNAFVLSLLGVTCLPALGGLLGVAVGLSARSDIDQSGGAKKGTWLANAAIGLGLASIVAWVLLAAWGIGKLTDWSRGGVSTPVAAPSLPPSPPATPTTPSPSGPSSPANGPGPSNRSMDDGVVETRVGTVDLVDVGPSVALLAEVLERQQDAARTDGQTLVLWLVVPDCAPCNGVSASLADPRMQRALENVRLVRVDVREFAVELKRLDVPIAKIPGFALLDPTHRPVDYVHGGEWDEDVPRNIAPVLEKFVRGAYTGRRDPWHRSDETPM